MRYCLNIMANFTVSVIIFMILELSRHGINMFSPWASVVDPGFSVGGRGPIGGEGPLTQALFTENVCGNKRIWSRRGKRAPSIPPRSANGPDID